MYNTNCNNGQNCAYYNQFFMVSPFDMQLTLEIPSWRPTSST